MNIVIVNCFDTYEHRVDLLREVLLEEGHYVKIFASDYRHFEKVKRIEPKTDFSFFKAEPYQKNLSYQRLHSHRKLSKDIFGYLEKQYEVIDLLWVLVPPNSFVRDAAKYKKNHQDTRLIFDLIDLWPETMPIGFVKNMFPFSAWRNLRDRNIKYADVVVTECKLYQQRLKKILRNMRTETLYLARPLITYEPHLNLPQDKINLCYLGSINNIIDINAIANIIYEIKRHKPVELHIVGDGESKDELILTAEKVGATVVFHGKVYDRVEKQRIFDSCHWGLNIMKKTVCVGLTMKSIDYMEFGLPLINNIEGDTWEIINRYHIGINTDDSISLLNIAKSAAFRNNARCFFEEYLTTKPFKETVLRLLKKDYHKNE